MSVFVVGSNGYIARRVIEELHSRKVDVFALSSNPGPDHIEFNLLNPRGFNYSRFCAGDLLLLSGGVSSPERCQQEPEQTYAINVIGTAYLIQEAIAREVRVVFFSSDTVYGATKQPVDEDTTPVPFGEYARMKRSIELQFSTAPLFKVLRLSYVFSRADKFTAYLEGCSRKGQTAEIFHPLLRRVVYLGDVFDLLMAFHDRWHHLPLPVVNVCGPELLSRIEMADLYREVVSPKLRVREIQPPAGFFQARPAIIDMSCSRFEALLGRRPLTLRQAMSVEFEERR